MEDSIGKGLDFAALDALLDRALELDEDARADFLDSLDPSQREAVLKLLRGAHSDVLGRVGEQVREAFSGLAAEAPRTEGQAGDWHLKREIGAGGTGQVFYAERRLRDDSLRAGQNPHEPADAVFVQRAAVKVLWSHRVASQFRDRFLRERRILASIDHPGLARFLDGGLLGDGRPWFAMEYVEGSNIIEFARALPIHDRLDLFVDVADTIDYAHRRLIVHRDIKPQNILVDSRGRPRVLDFGIARILGDSEEKDLTRALGAPVTLQYASPEQVTGGAIDVASDVYQLGLLLYELLANTRPYRIDETSLQAAIDSICGQVPPPPSAFNTDVDPDLDVIVAKAVRKAPQDRYASVAALAEDIRRFMAGRPIAARSPSRLYVLRRFIGRHTVTACIVAGSMVALSVATVFSLVNARQARAEVERSQTTQAILAAVFEQADPFGESGADITLSEALVRSMPSIRQQVSADPRLAWEVHKTLAGIFENLDMLEQERAAYQAAWDAAGRLEGDNESERLYAIAGLGNILAREDPGKAVAFLAEHLPASPANRRSAQSWLSAKYAEVNALDRLREDERADAGARDMDRVARQFEVDSPRTLGRIDTLMAGVSLRAGDTAAADDRWASAVANMRRADVPRGLAITLSNQALHYGKTGRFAEADRTFQESIGIFREHAPRDTSHANVQRLYAGLLFRMGRGGDALRTLEQAQSILDPSRQGYEYFVAQVERANIALALGDLEVALDAIERGVGTAAGAFGPDDDVTRRMVPALARLLLFADRPAEAAGLFLDREEGMQEPLCAASAAYDGPIDEAIRALANQPGVDAERRSLWGKVDAARASLADSRTLTASFVEATDAYRARTSVFLDVLDRYRLLSALQEIGRGLGLPLPVAQRAELDDLETLRKSVKHALREDGERRLRGVLEAMRVPTGGALASICEPGTRPAVVSREISRL